MSELNILEDLEDPEYYIRKIIESRIIGTGTHLTYSKETGTCISYRNIPIKGIEEPLYTLIDILFEKFHSILPEETERVSPSLIEERIWEIYTEFNIQRAILEDKLIQIHQPRENWNYMEKDLKISVTLNAFFDALDESRILEIETKSSKNRKLRSILERNAERPPKIKYELEDFAFVFRAKHYCELVSKYYSDYKIQQIKARLNKELKKLYIEYFVEKRQPTAQTQVSRAITKKNEILSEHTDFSNLVSALNSENTTQILNALEIIENKNLVQLRDHLEYLFNYPDEEVMNRALDVYMFLRVSE